MNEKQLELKISNSGEFFDFLKKFSSIDSSLLMEFNSTTITAKSHTPERSVVKSSSIALDEIFSEFTIDEPFKVGIFNIDKLKTAFKYFEGSDFTFGINLSKMQDEWVGTNIFLKNSSLDISFSCASLSLFTQITNDIMDKITDTSGFKSKFLLQREQLARITSLFGIDSDYSKITFEITKGKIYVKGKNFKYEVLDDADPDNNQSLSVFKHHYSFLDNETTEVYMMDDKLVLISTETDTRLIVGESE
jgi:hypothetical protein